MNALEIISLVQNGLSELNAYPVDFSEDIAKIDCAKTRKAVEDYQNMVINGHGLVKALEVKAERNAFDAIEFVVREYGVQPDFDVISELADSVISGEMTADKAGSKAVKIISERY